MDQAREESGSAAVAEKSLDHVLEFQRYEFKYRVPNRLVPVVVRELHRHMVLDEHSAGGRYYPIYSVYYDTEDFQAYYEKMDGVERRKKFRVRTYDARVSPDSTVMLEIKEKHKDIILKRREPVPASTVAAIDESSPVSTDSEVIREWRFSNARDSLKPAVLVAYRRLAFVPRLHGGHRITVDSDIRWGSSLHGTDFGAALRPVPSLRGHSVLEIKFGKRPPRFILDLVRRYDLRNDAISKYCESIIAKHRNVL